MKNICIAFIVIFSANQLTSEETTSYISHIDNTHNWNTVIILDNPTVHDESFSVIYYSKGKEVSEISGVLNSGHSEIIQTDSGTCGRLCFSNSNIISRVLYYHEEKGGLAEFKTSETLSQTLNILLPFYISESLSWYGIALFNPGDETADVILKAINSFGEVLTTTVISIESSDKMADTVDNLFVDLDFKDIAFIKAESTHPISGISLSGKDYDQFVFSNAESFFPTGKLFITHIAQEWNAWNNLLVLTNTGEETVETILTLFSSEAKTIKSDITIPSLESMQINLNDFQTLNPEWGTINITSSKLAVQQIFINTTSGSTAEFLLSNELSYNIMNYTLTPDITGLKNWTGISCLNTDSSSVSAIFNAWKNGIIQDTSEIIINGLSRTAITLDSLFPTFEPDRITAEGDNLTGILITSRNQSKLLFSPVSFMHNSNKDEEHMDLLTPEYYTNQPNSPSCNEINRFVETARKENLHHPFQNKEGSYPEFNVPNIGVFCSVKGPDAAATYHPAVDLHLENSQSQTAIFASHDGWLTLHRDDPKYRHHISILKDIYSDSGVLLGKLVTIYAHVDLVLDEEEFGHLEGTYVNIGDQISSNLYAQTVGGPHLHFEIRYYRAEDSGEETFYGLYSPDSSVSLVTPSSGPWEHGFWNTNVGYGYADSRNHGLFFYE